MEFAMAGIVGVLFACGTYLILKPNLIRLVMGFGIYSNAVNLLLITTGGYSKSKDAPFIEDSDVYSSLAEHLEIPALAGKLMDPLPPDIILTAIVISFAVGALLLTICYRVYLDHGTDDPDKLPVADLDGTVLGDDEIHGKGSA
jgi:multicomponent Na+:H+ antiporter subunit C